MSWIKLDDQWMDHPKIIAAGRDARDMWLASITYCAKHLTDGYFHPNILPALAVSAGVDVANCQDFARTLLEVGLWEATDGMYHIHDYLEYNPSKEQAMATKNARSEAGRRGAMAKHGKSLANAMAKPWQKSAPSPSPSPLNNLPEGAENEPPEAKPKQRRAVAHQENDSFQLAMALSRATGMDFEKNRTRLFKEAKAYKLEDLPKLQRDYAPGGPWFTCDWRGKRGELPTLAQIRETFGNLVTPAPNGNGGKKVVTAESLGYTRAG